MKVPGAWDRRPVTAVIRAVERYARANALSSAHRDELQKVLKIREVSEHTVGRGKLQARIATLLSGEASSEVRVELDPGEPWADTGRFRISRNFNRKLAARGIRSCRT